MTEPLAPTTIGERQAIAEREARQVCVDYRLSPESYERSGGKHPLQSYIEGAILRAFAALLPTTTNAPVAAQREAIARIVDPETWQANDDIEAGNHHGYSISKVGVDCAVSLAKADAILALRQTLPIHGEMREALREIINRRVCNFSDEYDEAREEMINAILALQGDGL
jgi:hypothetical protein